MKISNMVVDGLVWLLDKHAIKVAAVLGLALCVIGVYDASTTPELAPFGSLAVNKLFYGAAGFVGFSAITGVVIDNRRHERKHAALQ